MSRRGFSLEFQRGARLRGNIALFCLCLCTIALMVLAYQHATPEPPASPQPGFKAGSILAENAPEEPTRIAFLGDSWACGGGLTGADVGPSHSFLAQAAERLGWDYLDDCEGGTGYTRFESNRYGKRLGPIFRYRPDVVLVQGSTNDYAASREQVEQAAGAVYSALRSHLPTATLVVLGPAYTPAANRDLVDNSREALAKAAADANADWIDLAKADVLDLNHDFFDGYHPNNGGHAKLARFLARRLGAYGITR